MRKKLMIVLIVLFVLFGGIYAWHWFIRYETAKYFAHFVPPAVSVSVVKAEAVDWHTLISATGSALAEEGVDVAPEVPGKVVKLFFVSGAFIKKGDPLIQLNHGILQAQLKNNQAELELAKANYKRQETLFVQRATAQAELDQYAAQLKEAEAALQQTQAQLNQTRVRAPFSGVLGLRRVNLGQYIQAGTAIVNLQTVDPMWVDFAVPENQLTDIKAGLPVSVTTFTYTNKVFHGKILALNSQITSASRSLDVRAEVANPDQLLKPGMFVVVKVILPDVAHVIVIPQIAVTYSSVGNFVFVVKNNKAIRTYVTLGDRRGDKVAVLKGLNAGDVVVYAGQVQLQDQATVTIQPDKSAS